MRPQVPEGHFLLVPYWLQADSFHYRRINKATLSCSDVDDADAVVAPLPDKRGLAPALLNKEALLGLVRCGWGLKSVGLRFEKSSESNLFASLGDSLPHLLINSLALEVGTNRRIRPN